MNSILKQLYQYRQIIKNKILDIDSKIQKIKSESEKIKLEGKLEALTEIFTETINFFGLDDNEISYELYCKLNSYTDSPDSKFLYNRFLQICDLKKLVNKLIDDNDILEAAKLLIRFNKIKI